MLLAIQVQLTKITKNKQEGPMGRIVSTVSLQLHYSTIQGSIYHLTTHKSIRITLCLSILIVISNRERKHLATAIKKRRKSRSVSNHWVQKLDCHEMFL